MDSEKILVSILALSYNHEKYIRKCLDGFVMQQTHFKYEVLIHDDASTDRSAKIIREYQRRYPDIIFPIIQSDNQYSKGVRINDTYQYPRARGKYIAFCECDDYWTDSNKLQRQVDFMEQNPDYGLCYTDYTLLDEARESVIPSCFAKGKPRSSGFTDHLLSQGYIAPMTWLFRKEERDKFVFSEPFIDGSFALALEFFKHSKVGFLDVDTATHVSHLGSASNQTNPRNRFLYEKNVFKEQLYYARKYEERSIVNRICFDKYLNLLPDAMRFGDKEFIEDADLFFSSRDACFDDIARFAKRMNELRSDAFNARKSKSYQLGNLLIKPFKILSGLWRKRKSL